MKTPPIKKLIHDWNHVTPPPKRKKPISLADETLRDGLQSPSIIDPPLAKKIEILHLMERLGIQSLDLGLPGAGVHAKEDILWLAKEIVQNKMKIRPYCAVRTVLSDLEPLVEISEKAGIPIEAAAFIGSSPIRIYAEEWTLNQMLKLTEEAVTFCVKHGLPVMYVTEDTTRAAPEVIRKLYTTAIECGAKRITVCDTVGYATPPGVKAVIQFVQRVVKKTGEKVKIDWHGHRDRDLSVINSIAAVEAGVDQVHATGIGIGERVGNTPMDLLLVNLKLEGYITQDLTALPEYLQKISEAVGKPIPDNYPVFGKDAFRTATGVHAAAVIKAKKKGDDWLADRVYSGVPAGLFGRAQQIEVGFMSGASNVNFWLESRGVKPSPELVAAILDKAKHSNHILTDEEIWAVVKNNQNH
ncbi:MAG: LeuA family protein [Limisphaerales bacterium]